MKYIVVDFEMNPIKRIYKEEKAICNSEIIEIGAVMLDESMKQIDSFKSYVKPMFNNCIESNITKLTKISTAMVADANPFNVVMNFFCNWINSYNDSFQILSWSTSDFIQLTNEIELKGFHHPISRALLDNWGDIQKEYMDVVGFDRQVSLKNAVNFAGDDFSGMEHDALYDAINTAEILAIVRDEEKLSQKMGSVIDVMKPTDIGSSLGSLFDFGALMNQIA